MNLRFRITLFNLYHQNLDRKVFDNIYASLSWGGGFVMFEKVRGSDARFQDIMSNLYVNFKTEMGFSPSEILGKARVLKAYWNHSQQMEILDY